MPYKCCVKGCESTTYKGKHKGAEGQQSFFGFPTTREEYETWLTILSLKNDKRLRRSPQYAKICGKHFLPECIIKSGLRTWLKPGTIPSLLLKKDHLRESEEMSEIESSAIPNVQKSNQILNEPTSVMNTVDTQILDEASSSKETSEEHRHVTCKTLRYPGDIKENILKEMSPKKLRKCVTMLKSTLNKKSVMIKRLQFNERRLKKKLESMKALIITLRKQNLISSKSKKI